MSEKISVQLVQLNYKYGDQVYLPYSVGVLQTFVKQKKEIRENYNFKEFIFLRENVSNIANKIGQVDILGISCYMWNWRISLKLAEEVRRKNPNCMIFLGGPHVPDAIDENFFKTYHQKYFISTHPNRHKHPNFSLSLKYSHWHSVYNSK